MAAKDQHVVPHQKGWAVCGEGSRRATQVFASKQDAIDRAIEIARALGSKMRVHGSSGQIFQRPDISPHREAKIRRAVRGGGVVMPPTVDIPTPIRGDGPGGRALPRERRKEESSRRRRA